MPKAGVSKPMKSLQNLLSERVASGTHSVAEIADKTGLQASIVYKYMRGERPGTTLDTFLALLDAVGAHPSDVFGERKAAPPGVLEMHEAIGRYLKGK